MCSVKCSRFMICAAVVLTYCYPVSADTVPLPTASWLVDGTANAFTGGSGFDGTLMGTASFGAAGTGPFAGEEGVIGAMSVSGFGRGTAGTISMWVKSPVSTWGFALDDAGSSAGRSYVEMNASGPAFSVAAPGISGFTTTNTSLAAGWHNLVFTWDDSLATKQTVYLDGSVVGTSAEVVYSTTPTTTYFGCQNTTGLYTIGQIAEYGYWDTALTASNAAWLGSNSIAGLVSSPEPSTLVLLATGLIGLLCYAWRKRR